MRKQLQNKKRLIIKIGSSILVNEEGQLLSQRFRKIAKTVAELRENKVEVALVSSGAIAAGMSRLNMHRKPKRISLKQAVAAAGQHALMFEYEKAFAKHQLKVAQVLVSRDDFANRRRYLNIRHSLFEIRKLGLIPIINENDSVATDEIKFGDNDNLSALVTSAYEADLLIILSDVDGVYDLDPYTYPDAKRLSMIEKIDEQVKLGATDTLRPSSTGGMRTKLEAAEKAQHYGVATLIASGHSSNVIQRILQGKDIGTLIIPQDGDNRLSAKKHWLAYNLKALGSLRIDPGAGEALKKGRSLLSSGVMKVEGNFNKGDPVDIFCKGEKKVLARGLTSYNSIEIEKIKGLKSSQIEKALGYKYMDEIIHRNDLVILA